MSRLSPAGIGILSGVLAMFVSGFIAVLAVDWYRIPGREGESGYFGGAVFDTRQPAVHAVKTDTTISNNFYVPSFALSPDERSFVTYATTDDSLRSPLAVVTDFVANRTYTLPIDPSRMRYAKVESIDPASLNHHFVWQLGRDGVDHLIERAGFVPIPYRGEVTVEKDGYRTYRLDKGTEALRGVLIEFLAKEFNAARQPADSGAYDVP